MPSLGRTCAVGLLALLCALPIRAQAPPDSLATGQAMTVFLDCDRCDDDYVRREITFVDYVRDRTEAQVHLLITTQRAGSGREYALTFIGQDEFADIDETLRYVSSNTDTDDETRQGYTQMIRLGLVRYLARTPLANQLSVSVDEDATASQQIMRDEDPWNFWVFRVGFNGALSAEDVTDAYRLSSNVNADRTTENWKLRFSGYANYRESSFDLEDEKITSVRRDGGTRGSVIKSLGPRWSFGGFAGVNTSSFNNTDLSVSVAPAIEFNVFPYSESSRRDFRFTYKLNFRAFEYEEVTIFDQTSETLLHHEFEIDLEFDQPWGEASASFEASSYLTDFDESLMDLYRLELFGFVQVRLVRGLSIYAHGSISRIRDQIFLPKATASDEDILLGNVRLPTSSAFNVSLGLSYTFGSIFNNIVNPRF